MSLKALSAAFECQVPHPSTKLTLLCLADHANEHDDYQCWPSQARMSKRTGLSVRSVVRAVADLEDLGLIRSTQATSASKVSKRYWLNYKNIVALVTSQQDAEVKEIEGVTPDTMTGDLPTPCQGAPYTMAY